MPESPRQRAYYLQPTQPCLLPLRLQPPRAAKRTGSCAVGPASKRRCGNQRRKSGASTRDDCSNASEISLHDGLPEVPAPSGSAGGPSSGARTSSRVSSRSRASLPSVAARDGHVHVRSGGRGRRVSADCAAPTLAPLDHGGVLDVGLPAAAAIGTEVRWKGALGVWGDG